MQMVQHFPRGTKLAPEHQRLANYSLVDSAPDARVALHRLDERNKYVAGPARRKPPEPDGQANWRLVVNLRRLNASCAPLRTR